LLLDDTLLALDLALLHFVHLALILLFIRLCCIIPFTGDLIARFFALYQGASVIAAARTV
jgi:hypothetical protein